MQTKPDKHDNETKYLMMEQFREHCHADCFICSKKDQKAWLEFNVDSDGTTRTLFNADSKFQGYTGQVHGGVIASAIDATMANCLFASEIKAVTASLSIRYLEPAWIGKAISVSTKITKRSLSLFILQAEVVQDGVVKASAVGKFMLKKNSGSVRMALYF